MCTECVICLENATPSNPDTVLDCNYKTMSRIHYTCMQKIKKTIVSEATEIIVCPMCGKEIILGYEIAKRFHITIRQIIILFALAVAYYSIKAIVDNFCYVFTLSVIILQNVCINVGTNGTNTNTNTTKNAKKLIFFSHYSIGNPMGYTR